MDERQVRERLNDAARAFRFDLEGSERAVRRARTRLLVAQTLATTVLVGAIAVAAMAFTGGEDGIISRPQGPAGDGAHVDATIEQGLVDRINGCVLLLVTQEEVESALGFRPEDPAQWEGSGGVLTGCRYASPGQEGGQMIVSAYAAGAPPAPLGRSEPVEGIGDEAIFTRYGNGDEHVPGPEGATSILEVRRGGLILRFDAGVFDATTPYLATGADLTSLRKLVYDALTTLDAVVPRPRATVPDAPGFKIDYTIDLNSGETTPLPETILRSAGKTGADGLRTFIDPDESGQYAASPDGSRLAYVGPGDNESLQIFIAGIDGTGVRQMTHDSKSAASPAWSPDGKTIAYVGYGTGDVRNLFVLDVATGESTQITDEANDAYTPQFTPDGSSLIYGSGTDSYPTLRIVPVDGGASRILVSLSGKLSDAGNGALSPDGSLITFLGSEGGPGPIRFLANADGSDRRIIPGWVSSPAGTWSPDGTRIVCSDGLGIIVVDIATEESRPVADGQGAIWLDDHTLLVEF